MKETLTPRPYQTIGRDFLTQHPRALLADEMRVGKTPQAILAADAIGAKRVLVICPAIATIQWVNEWARWSPERPAARILEPSIGVADCKGPVVVSYARAVSLQSELLAAPPWEAMIVDEAHFAKNPKAQRTRAVYGKGGIGWNAANIWALSGTPAPNHAGELWPMLRAFGAVKMSYEDFIHYFCYYDPTSGRVWGNKPRHLPQLRSLLAPFLLRRKRADVAPEMPGISYNFLSVAPTEGVDLSTTDLAHIDTDDRISVAMAKVPEMVDEITFQLAVAKGYDQTVVFGYHREPLNTLCRALNGAGIPAAELNGSMTAAQRAREISRFHGGAIKVVCAQIIAAGTAIDLSPAQHGYFLELDFVPGNNEQAANRLVNMQTKLPVTFDIMNWPGTRDDAVQRSLIRKVKGAVFK